MLFEQRYSSEEMKRTLTHEFSEEYRLYWVYEELRSRCRVCNRIWARSQWFGILEKVAEWECAHIAAFGPEHEDFEYDRIRLKVAKNVYVKIGRAGLVRGIHRFTLPIEKKLEIIAAANVVAIRRTRGKYKVKEKAK